MSATCCSEQNEHGWCPVHSFRFTATDLATATALAVDNVLAGTAQDLSDWFHDWYQSHKEEKVIDRNTVAGWINKLGDRTHKEAHDRLATERALAYEMAAQLPCFKCCLPNVCGNKDESGKLIRCVYCQFAETIRAASPNHDALIAAWRERVIAQTRNYVADSEQCPQKVTFENGRTVRIVGDYLEVD